MQIAAINSDLMVKLRYKGVSVKAIAERLSVPKQEVEEIVREHEPDRKALSFADRLAGLLAEVPTEYCRQELERSINIIREHHTLTRAGKRQKVLHAIASGALEIEEICEECRFRQSETEELLNELIAVGKVEKRQCGGVLNRGRKMKHHYHLTAKI